MAVSTSMTHRVSKSLYNNNDGAYMNWFKTNFNMPVPNLFANTSGWTRYSGCFTYGGESTSYNLSGFSYGYEICLFSTIWDWYNSGGGDAYLNEQIWSRWVARDGSTTIFWGAYGNTISATLPEYYWQEYMYCVNIGTCPWEIDVSGNFYVRSSSTGNYPMSETSTTVTMTNVPYDAYHSGKGGYIWVEGSNLCYIDATTWKKTISGTYISSSPGASKAGYMWIDTMNYLHWVGSDGYDYRVPWIIRQFASSFSNGPTGSVYAGTSKAGYIWVDHQFGQTHLSYIGYDGYKYLTGGADHPY